MEDEVTTLNQEKERIQYSLTQISQVRLMMSLAVSSCSCPLPARASWQRYYA